MTYYRVVSTQLFIVDSSGQIGCALWPGACVGAWSCGWPGPLYAEKPAFTWPIALTPARDPLGRALRPGRSVDEFINVAALGTYFSAARGPHSTRRNEHAWPPRTTHGRERPSLALTCFSKARAPRRCSPRTSKSIPSGRWQRDFSLLL